MLKWTNQVQLKNRQFTKKRNGVTVDEEEDEEEGGGEHSFQKQFVTAF